MDNKFENVELQEPITIIPFSCVQRLTHRFTCAYKLSLLIGAVLVHSFRSHQNHDVTIIANIINRYVKMVR